MIYINRDKGEWILCQDEEYAKDQVMAAKIAHNNFMDTFMAIWNEIEMAVLDEVIKEKMEVDSERDNNA